MTDLSKLSKKKLEELGREYGIELDRRLKKDALVVQLQEHIQFCECGNTEDENGVCDGSHQKEATPAPVQSTGEYKFIGKTLHLDGSVAYFSDKLVAKRLGRKLGGRQVALDDGTWIVKKY